MFPLFSILRREKNFATQPHQFVLLHLKRLHLMEWVCPSSDFAWNLDGWVTSLDCVRTQGCVVAPVRAQLQAVPLRMCMISSQHLVVGLGWAVFMQ